MNTQGGDVPRPHATESAIRSALLELLARPYDPRLLPEADAHLPEDQRAKCDYPETLRIPGVRLDMLIYWNRLHQWCQPSATQIQQVADDRTRWIVKQYLPAWREKLSDLASELMAQLCGLLALPDLTDQLPAMVFPEDGEPAPEDRCLYSCLLRSDTVRPLILAASQQMTAQQRDNPKERRRVARPILRKAMRDYGDLIGDANVARFTTRSGGRHGDQESRRRYASEVLCAEHIPVTALKNCGVASGNYLIGDAFEVDVLEFLDDAHHFAHRLGRLPQPHALTRRIIGKRWPELPRIDADHVPIYLATRQHAATKARTCWDILEVLGARRHRGAGHPAHMTISELVKAITGSVGGKRFAEIRDMAAALHTLGLVKMETADDASTNGSSKLALDIKKVKTLRKSPP